MQSFLSVLSLKPLRSGEVISNIGVKSFKIFHNFKGSFGLQSHLIPSALGHVFLFFIAD